MENQQTTFDSWAIVEIMGHKRYAGRVTEQTIGGASFVRVDVPAIKEIPGFSKLFGAGSIYCITPCTEETARAFVDKLQERAFGLYEIPRLTLTPRGSGAEGDYFDEIDE